MAALDARRRAAGGRCTRPPASTSAPAPRRRWRCRSWPRSWPLRPRPVRTAGRGAAAASERRARHSPTDPVCGMAVAAVEAVAPPRPRRRPLLVLRQRLPAGLRRRPRRLPAHVTDRGSTSRSPTSTRCSGALDDADYLADLGLATALFCAVRLPQPLLLEGEAGVGKTEAAKALARVLDTPLVRLQCYEGIDAAEALYEWNYPRQLLGIRLAEAAGRDARRARPVRPRLPRRAAAAAGHRAPRSPAGGAADRRGRPGRRRVRGVPVRAAGRVGGHHPRAGHPAGHPPAGRGPHVEPHPRPARRPQAALPLPLDRLPRRSTGPWRSSGGGCRPRRPRSPSRWRRRCSGCARSTCRSRPGIAEAIDWVAAARAARPRPARRRRRRRRRSGSVLKYREDLDLARERGLAGSPPDDRTDVDSTAATRLAGRPELDLADVVGAVGQLLHAAGVPVTPERSGRFATAVALGAAGHDRRALLGRAGHAAERATSRSRRTTAVFAQVFRGLADVGRLARARRPVGARARQPARTRRRRARPPTAARGRRAARARRPPRAGRPADDDGAPGGADLLAAASADERLGPPTSPTSRPTSWPASGGAWSALPVATAAARVSRRTVRHPRGRDLDLRATLRRAHGHGGDPVAGRTATGAGGPAARAAGRRLGLDGALRPRLPPPAARRRCGPRGPRRSCSPPA